jgi:serine/threonine-protein kinase
MTVNLSPTGEQGRVLGQYRLLHVLGEGGMGTVYVAEHVKLGRRFALKLLKPEHAQNATSVRRFFDEARVVNQINHEHIVEVIDFVDGDEKYIVMELLQGQTLREVMEQGTLPFARLLDVAEQVAQALAAVHAASVVHRDLKPDNIFLTERAGRRDFVKLLDFGVAKLGGETNEAMAVNRTAAGAILGTPEYMAPEQLAGKAVDARADIYAFGIILFEMVCGKKPFVAESFGEIVIKHLTIPPPDPAALARVPVPKELCALISQCLEKDPAARPASMKWVHSAVLGFSGKGEVVKIATKRSRAPLVAAVSVGAVALLAIAAWRFWPRPIPPAPVPAVIEPAASAPVVAPPPAASQPAPVVAAQPVVEKNLEKEPAKGKKKGAGKKKKKSVDKGGLFDPFGN